MSPVNDAYSKKGLAPAQHRVEMCRLAAQTSDIAMVDSWEAEQPTYQRTLMVLQRLEQALNEQPSGRAGTCSAHTLCYIGQDFLQPIAQHPLGHGQRAHHHLW